MQSQGVLTSGRFFYILITGSELNSKCGGFGPRSLGFHSVFSP
jgi:hypothetical protein